MTMTCIYNNVDLSAYITKYGFSEAFRVIDGPNKGMAINGDDIPDVIAVKHDVTFTLRPLESTTVSELWALIEALPQFTYNTLIYTSANGQAKTINAKITSTAAKLVMNTSERTLYDGIVLTFTEK